jgi:hypothetical protein
MITRVWAHSDGARVALEIDEGDGGILIADEGTTDLLEVDQLDEDDEWRELHP